ncbi:MAG TPA: aminotransferase class V-fold PLP-dependent enzyme [Chloroflexota bacterium]|jgi:D-glucosaminate-6-phosphate ammonia-lyase|nr:aminotransferase class V-fold PLP-dependent enzyme [Chloroflexota bacterium]
MTQTLPAGVAAEAAVYEDLGLRPVINARGNQTVLGGALLAPPVLEAMAAANRYFVDMDALLEQSGRQVAALLECEAAYVTPGCAAALTLGTAACMTGDDGSKMERLPDSSGMRREVVIQARHRYKYDRAVTVPGAVLREAGDASGTTPEQLAAAIGPQTAAVLVPAHEDGREGTVPLNQVIELAHQQGVPVLLDAAAQVYPLERMRGWTKLGADLVCFGAKYFGAPHSTGLLCGRRDLVESASQQGFIGFERGRHRPIGRPFKVDRGEIVAVVVALRAWMTMDHEARIARVQERVDAVVRRLEGIAGVTATAVPRASFGAPALRVQLQPSAAGGQGVEGVARALAEGNPSIQAHHDADSLHFNLTTVVDGDEQVIAERLRTVLAG